ncbi:MAG: ATP-binding protein [Thermodesulfobacteriota bacterium]
MSLAAAPGLGPFDREVALGELLDPRKLDGWAAGVCRSLGIGAAVTGASGELCACRLPLEGSLGEALRASLAEAAAAWCADLDALGRAPGGSEEREASGFTWRAAPLWSGADPVGLLVLGPRLEAGRPWGAAGEALARVRPGTVRALLPILRESLEWIIRSETARRMVSALHLETVEDGQRELAEANQRLRDSEAQLQFLVEDLSRGVQAAAEETARAQGEAYLREKQASVGRLAAGIAHEINNPLAFVAGNLGTARQYLEDLFPVLEAARGMVEGDADEDPARLREASRSVDLGFLLEDFRALLDEAREGADRVSRIVRDLKDFSRVDRVEGGRVDLGESLHTAARLAAGRAADGVALSIEEHSEPVLVVGDGAALHQALWNLLENALWAAAQGGTRVRLACGKSPGGEAWFEVEDDGPGVPPECLPLLFDPFYTTKEVGEGAGLGLAVVRDVARAHGGRAEVFSEPGRGARFRVTLPVGDLP